MNFDTKKSSMSKAIASKPRRIFTPHSTLGWKLSPNARVKVKFRNNIIQNTDAEGWRVVVDQPRLAERKIAFYGCSFTYGTGLEDEETFTSLLQKEFPEVKIINRGVGGHGTVQNYIQFRSDVKNKLIDTAVFCLISDHRFRNIGHPKRMKAFLSPEWHELGIEHIPRARINREGCVEIEYLSIERSAISFKGSEFFLPPDYYLDEASLKTLDLVKRHAEENRIPMKIVILDSDDLKFNDLVVRRFGQMALDISAPYNRNLTFFPDDYHPNGKANQLFKGRMAPLVRNLLNESG